MKKLRLLVTNKCNRDCPKCCNKSFNLHELPIETDYSQYNEISLTGGEPMLYPFKVARTIQDIRRRSNARIYMYTANTEWPLQLLGILYMLDGLTVSIHDRLDLESFKEFRRLIPRKYGNKTLRLKINSELIDESDDQNIRDFIHPHWVTDTFRFIENCPLPKNEVFKRLEL